MNILIDTNILIPLEDTGRTLDASLATMRQLSEQNGHILYIHSAQRQDIHRDRDEKRREIVLSRLAQYQFIPDPPPLSEQDLQRYGWSQNTEQDEVDKILSFISKRTIYSKKEITTWFQQKILVILFRFIGNFPPVNRASLIDAGIKGSIQSIRKISHEQYLRCFTQNYIK